MPIHKNCYELVREVRQGLNEYDDALASGDDTVGAFRNDFIVTQINRAIRDLFALIARRKPNEFLKEQSLTAVNSVFTLPADYGKLILFRDDYGRKVYPIEQVERRLAEQTGSERLYYQKGRTLVLDRAGITSTYTLIYKSKPREIHLGKAQAGGVGSITLAPKSSILTADHYNGMTIEDVTADFASEIIDYTAARVATITGTAVAGDLYGLVPEIPEWSHGLIAPKATIYCKLLPSSKEPPGKAEVQLFNEQLIALFREYATADEDQDFESIFTSFEPKTGQAFY